LAGAFILGVPLAAGLLCLVHFGPIKDTSAHRYLSHPIENVEILMFCCALGALSTKLIRNWTERRACGACVLPAWDGYPVPVSEAGPLLAGLDRLPRRWQSTLLVNRVANVLDFVRHRGSAADLDDHLRTLTDNDALALETSYSLIRFITWAIPILGFLGTVLGITGAISGVTPEVLEKSLSTVTNGLSLAFDATALALALTMAAMFLSFLVERAEQGVLESVDLYADRHLAHRFERIGVESGPFTEAVRHHSQLVLQNCEHLVQRQTELWAKTLEDMDRRRAEAELRQQERLTTALETVLDRTRQNAAEWTEKLEELDRRQAEVGQRQQERLGAAVEAALEMTLRSHAEHLAGVEKQTVQQCNAVLERLAALATAVRDGSRDQQAALAQVAQAVTAQVEAVRRLSEDEKQIVSLQETLDQNLAVLAGAGSLDQAVHSLTAAIHLLTARSAAVPPSRSGPRPGVAA
jgi:hypothetical protein